MHDQAKHSFLGMGGPRMLRNGELWYTMRTYRTTATSIFYGTWRRLLTGDRQHCREALWSDGGGWRVGRWRVRAFGPRTLGKRVGMRAKRYMSDANYTYIGTVTSAKLYKSVVGIRQPKVAAETTWAAKVQRNAAVLSHLKKVRSGPYRDQFANRLQDAIALAEHNWSYFSTSAHEIPEHRRRSPTQLGLDMRRDGLLPRKRAPEAAETPAQTRWQASAAAAPPPIKQRMRLLADAGGVSRGSGVPVSTPFGGHQPKTVEEFKQRPVVVGSFVLTRAHAQDRIERASLKLSRLRAWIWKVLHIYRAGSKLPPNLSCIETTDSTVYECHLYVPTSGTSWQSPVKPVWDMQAETTFLSRAAAAGASSSVKEVHVPFTALLRPGDILGGGFVLTSSSYIPNIVRNFLEAETKENAGIARRS